MVNFHYCMDKLDSTHLFAGKTDKCGKCGMHTGSSHGCCRDEVQLIKMSEDQKTGAGFAFSLPSLKAVLVAPSAFIFSTVYSTPAEYYYTTHSPPLISQQDIYLENCVFRI